MKPVGIIPCALFLTLMMPQLAAAQDEYTRDDIQMLLSDKNLKLKYDKLKTAVESTTFDWSFEDAYMLIDAEVPEDIVRIGTGRAGMFYDGTNKSMNQIWEAGYATAQPQTIKVTNTDFVVVFEFFNDQKYAIQATADRLGSVEPQQSYETDDVYFERKRRHEEAIHAATAPIAGAIEKTTFEAEVTGGFKPHDGSCGAAEVQVDLAAVSFDLFRYTLGGKRTKVPIQTSGSNVATVEFAAASGSRFFQATSNPICVSSGAYSGLQSAGSKLKVTFQREYGSDNWKGSAEFVNARTGSRL